MLANNIAIYPTTSDLIAPAELLAKQLNLPLVLENEHTHGYLLTLTPDYLGLYKANTKSPPLFVDFLSKQMHYRCQKLSLKKEALARAMGLKKHSSPKIIDATGGLARDSFIIASLGFEIQLCERSPIIQALLADGIQRAENQPTTALQAKRLHVKPIDAISYLSQLKNQDRPDIIYLDPMFPERKKTALPKQDMLIFHEVVGDDSDANQLLKMALACAIRRVVVKRPRLAESLAGTCPPSYTLTGRSSRFDVYII